MSNPAPDICKYCGLERDGVEGWHGCNQSMDEKKRIEDRISEYSRIADGDTQSQTKDKEPENGEL